MQSCKIRNTYRDVTCSVKLPKQMLGTEIQCGAYGMCLNLSLLVNFSFNLKLLQCC